MSHPQFLDPRLPPHFWAKCIPEPNSGCWLWLAASTWGYGAFAIDTKPRRAHRVAYLTLVGPIPDGLELDHLCRERSCCNPAHLEPVTRYENLVRGDTIVARAIRRTHCPQGHPYDAKNTRLNISPNGKPTRDCRACDREQKRRLREERRALQEGIRL